MVYGPLNREARIGVRRYGATSVVQYNGIPARIDDVDLSVHIEGDGVGILLHYIGNIRTAALY